MPPLHKNSWFKNLTLMVKLGFICLILHSMNYKSLRKLNSNLLGISLKLFHSPLWSTYHDAFEKPWVMLKFTSGLNTIQTYVEWSSHEKRPGNYTGLNDIVSFIKTAQDVGLDVILRPGPFIDAERDFGGLPSWLLKNPDVKLRTSDKYFMERVTSWYTKLFSFLTPLLFKNGGPITMVQVENEYGSFALQTGHKDVQYLEELRDLIKHLVCKKL